MAKGKKTEVAVVDLIVDGKSAKSSVKDLGQALSKVTKELREMAEADNPAKYARLRAEKRKLTEEYIKQKNTIQDLRTEWEKFQDQARMITTAVVGGNLLFTAIEKVANIIPRLVSTSGTLSDELADVQKQTGLAGAELEGLNEDLSKLNTRTPIEKLRGLAAVAGKLGYQTRQEVLEFVKAADKIGVALAEDLGGNVEEALNDVGKLTEIYGLTDEFGVEKALLKTASAINTIGASSAANEGYLVEWSKRFAGIAPNANIGIADTLGLAATMDILGQSSELSATNVGKMVVAIGKDVPYFAKVARMEVGEFTKLLKTDANEGLLRVLEGAKSTSGGLEGLVKTLETLGIDGSEGAQVLGALTKNTQLLREQQDIANKSFTEGTSIINEYNVKNNNTAAILEKISNKIAGWWESASGAMDPLIIKFGKILGVVSSLDIELGKFKVQMDLVNATEKNVVPLIDRYDFLRTRVKLTVDEQKELDTITRQLAEAVPGAVSEVDKYGNALNVNTWKVRDFVKEQKELLETMRQQQKQSIADEISRMEREAKRIQEDFKRGKTKQVVAVTMQGAVTDDVPMTNEVAKEAQATLSRLQMNIRARRMELKELEGIADITERRIIRGHKAAQKSITSNTDAIENAGGYEGLSKDQADNMTDKYQQVQDELLQIRQRFTLESLVEDEKEIAAAHFKYEKLRELAKGNAKLLAEINRTEAEETQFIQDSYKRKHSAGVKELDFSIKPKDMTDEVASDMKGYYENAMTGVESNLNNQITRIDTQHATRNPNGQRAITDADAYQQKLAAEEQYLTAKLLLQKTYGQQTLDTERQLQENAVAQLDLRYTRESEIREAMKRAEWELQDAKREAFAAGLNILSSFVDESSALYKVLLIGQKAIAIADIIINLQREIAGYYASYAIFGTAGLGIATKLSLGAKIRAGISIATIGAQAIKELATPEKTPEKAEGGYTDMRTLAEGFVHRPTLFSMGTRRYIAGEAGTEFIINNRSLRHPAVANFAGMMDAIQKSRNYSLLNQFPSGGIVNQAGTVSSTGVINTAPDFGEMIQAVNAMNANMNKGFDQLNKNLSESGHRPVVFNTKTFDKHKDFILKIQNDVNV